MPFPQRALDQVRDFLAEIIDGLADLLQVGGAAVAGAQVIVDAGSPAWRQVPVEVITDEPDEVAAGEVVRRRGQQGARVAAGGLVAGRRGQGLEGLDFGRGGLGGAGGQDQQRGEGSAGADDDPPGRVHAAGAGQGAEAE